jgi:hypothetical protein
MGSFPPINRPLIISILIIALIAIFIVQTLLLKLAGNLLKVQINFKKALLITIIAIVATVLIKAASLPFIFMKGAIFKYLKELFSLIALMAYVIMPKLFLKLDWGKGIGIGVIWLAFGWISGLIALVIIMVLLLPLIGGGSGILPFF